MADFAILSSDVPLGGVAVANLGTANNGVAEDQSSVTAVWKDNTGATLVSMTRTVADISTTDIHGQPATLTDPAGTGTYRSTLQIANTGVFVPPATGLTFTLTVSIIGPGGTRSQIFTFKVISTAVTITLDGGAILDAVKRATGMREDVMHVASNTNALVSLGKGPVYAIAAAYKNGAAITSGTNYTWNTYQTNVTLVVPPAVNDHFLFRIDRAPTEYVDDIVARYSDEVRSAFIPHYAYADFITATTYSEIVKALAIGQIRQDRSSGVALESANYRSGVEIQQVARARIKAIVSGVEDLYDSSGVAIERLTGTIAGGHRSDFGEFVNRLGLQDRAQHHTGLYIELQPDPILNPAARVLA